MYEIAKTCHLTAYDAAYLELAMRKDATLATLDKQLVKASNLSGVNLFS
jgi:predicted nucleic acid-binding protein